jgi:hypothetical protein
MEYDISIYHLLFFYWIHIIKCTCISEGLKNVCLTA